MLGVPARRVMYLVLVALVAACHMRPNREPVEVRYVEVDNQGYADMNVFVVEGTRKVKIGMATGSSTTRLMLPRSMSRGIRVLSFVCDPIGGSQNSFTQDVTVAPGQNILLRIQP